jgi:DNA-binding IclR family transcriptional regulator
MSAVDETGSLDARAPEQVAGERGLAGAQVVDRVVDILEAFPRLGPELGVADVSRALGLKRATTHRLLASLHRRGILAQDAVSRRYRLGMKLWELGSLATSQVDWLERVKPHLQQLAIDSGETAHLAILNDGQVLYVDTVESVRSLRMPSQVGGRLPVHCSGVGKALVAYLPEEAVRGIFRRRGLPRMTAHTITDARTLERQLATVRKLGYAIDDEEMDEGLTCIAAPVRDHTSHVMAAVSIAGPTSRLSPDVRAERAGQVVQAANDASVALGCPKEVLWEVGLSRTPA